VRLGALQRSGVDARQDPGPGALRRPQDPDAVRVDAAVHRGPAPPADEPAGADHSHGAGLRARIHVRRQVCWLIRRIFPGKRLREFSSVSILHG